MHVEQKTFSGFQDTVPLMFLSKNLLFRTLGSQRNFYKNKLGITLRQALALCTLSSNISAPKKTAQGLRIYSVPDVKVFLVLEIYCLCTI